MRCPKCDSDVFHVGQRVRLVNGEMAECATCGGKVVLTGGLNATCLSACGGLRPVTVECPTVSDRCNCLDCLAEEGAAPRIHVAIVHAIASTSLSGTVTP